MKKNKNSKWIFLGVILIFFAIVFIYAMRNSSETNEEELLFECSKNISLEDKIENKQKMKLYKNGDDLKLVQSSYMHYFNNPSEEQLELVSIMVEQNLKEKINNKFGEDSNDVEFVSKRDDKTLYFDIIYTINENNSKDIEILFEFDFYNSSSESIMNYFEGDGFVCKRN